MEELLREIADIDNMHTAHLWCSKKDGEYKYSIICSGFWGSFCREYIVHAENPLDCLTEALAWYKKNYAEFLTEYKKHHDTN